MQVFRYFCDGGSLAIGSEHARVSICNEIGDGTYSIFITNRNETAELADGRFSNRDNWTFLGAVDGDCIKVFDYDCYHTAEEANKHILVTLSGRYGIWVEKLGGDFWLQKWE